MAAAVHDLMFLVLFTTLLAALTGVLWTWWWAIGKLWRRQPVLLETEGDLTQCVPWGLPSVLLTIVVYLVVASAITKAYASSTGTRPPRAERTSEAPGAPPGREVALGPAVEKLDVQSYGELMLQSAIINVVLLVLIPAVLVWASGATPRDLGWDTRNWRKQIFHGIRAGLLITPVVFAIQGLAIRIWPPQKHPLELMVQEQFSIAGTVLAIVSAMILAPLIEELLFRAVLQPWLGKLFWRPSDDVGRVDYHASATHEDGADGWDETLQYPVDAMPGQGSAKPEAGSGPRSVRAATLAILVTSVLFAGMHHAVWPSPVPIFFLSLWLGTVYQGSRSLLTVAALHGTFNGFSTLGLLLEALSRKHEAAGVHGVLRVFSDLVG